MKRFLVFLLLVAAIGIAALSLFRPLLLQRVVVEARERTGLIEPSTRLEKQRLIVQVQDNALRLKMQEIAADMASSDVFRAQVEEMVRELGTSDHLSDEDRLLLAKAQLFLRYEDGSTRLSALLTKIDHSISLARLGQLQDERVDTDALEREVETEVRYIEQITAGSEPEVLPLVVTPQPTATPEPRTGNKQ